MAKDVNSEQIDAVRRLAAEAARETYSPRAKTCWPWMHEWTMWQLNFPGSSFQRRRCLRCGWTAEKLV